MACGPLHARSSSRAISSLKPTTLARLDAAARRKVERRGKKGSQQQAYEMPKSLLFGRIEHLPRNSRPVLSVASAPMGGRDHRGKALPGSPASNGESFLCGSCKSVILRANRTGLLTFVAGAAGRALRIVVKTDLVLARIGNGDVRRPPSSASQTSSACRRTGGGSRRQGFK